VRRHQVDVLALVVVGHLDPGAAGRQLHHAAPPEEVGLLGEGEVQHVGDVVVQHPPQIFEKGGVHGLDVLVAQRRAQHVLVEGAREVRVDGLPRVQRLAHHAPHELEKIEVVGAARRVRLHHRVGVGLEGGAALGHGLEQRERGVEHLAGDEL
jgi:hypothetical protein